MEEDRHCHQTSLQGSAYATARNTKGLRNKKVLVCSSLFLIAIFTIANFRTGIFSRRLSSSLPSQDVDHVDVDENLKRMPADKNKIRYATFGTSQAWGAGMDDRKNAFIWHLSPDAANFAVRSSGSEYPSKCLSSMIGDQIFDVIILEFTSRINPSTYLLAKRLRHRFPDAIIINLKNYTPYQVYSKTLDKSARTVALENGFTQFEYMHHKRFHGIIHHMNVHDWEIDWREDSLLVEDDMSKDFDVKHTRWVNNPNDPL